MLYEDKRDPTVSSYMYEKVTLRNTELYLEIHNIRISMDGMVVFKIDASFSGGRGFRSSSGDRLTKFSSSSSDPTCKYRDSVSNHEKTGSFHILFTELFTNHPIIHHYATTVTKDGVW